MIQFLQQLPSMTLGLVLYSWAVFFLLVIWEIVLPKRKLKLPRWKRWTNNVILNGINILVPRFIMPITTIWVAYWVNENGWWLWSIFYESNDHVWIQVISWVILLDFLLYVQHVLFHKYTWLWVFHKVHHLDQDMDVTTWFRFHIGEIVLSVLYKAVFIVILGIHPVAVIVFELILTVGSMYTHSNIQFPMWLDRVIRWFVVTPDMHRSHHSIIRGETDSNYSFHFSVWDRIFKTYTDTPSKGHDGVEIWLEEKQDGEDVTVVDLLKMK